MNPQHQSGHQDRKDFGSNPPKRAPSKGQSGKSGSGNSGSERADAPGTQPQNPADLGFDPKPDNVQARGVSGQSSEKSSR